MEFYYLEKKGYGKHYYYIVKKAKGKKLEQLKDSGAKIFSSRKHAWDYAINLRKN